MSFQSVKEPLCSLIWVSLTTTDHLPRPVSPLGRMSVDVGKVKRVVFTNERRT